MAEQQPSSHNLKQVWLAWLLIAVTPFIFIPLGTDPYSNLRWLWLAGLGAAGLWSIRHEWAKVFATEQQWFIGAILLFALTGAVGTANSLHPIHSAIEVIRWLMIGGLAIVLAFKFQSKSFQTAAWKAMTVATLGLTILWLLQTLEIVGRIPAHGDPGAATLGNLNFFAGGMLVLTSGCILLGIRGEGIWKWLGWIATAAAILMVALGKSAGAWLAMVILIAALAEAVFIHRFPKNIYATKTWIRPAVWAAAALLAVILFWQFGGSFRQESSGLERVAMAEKSIEMIRENPLLGIGAGEWSYHILEKGVVSNYQGFATRYLMQAHNDFLQMTAERGLIGGLAFIFIFLVPIIQSFRSTTAPDKCLERLIATAAILAWAAFALTSLPISRPFLIVLLVVYVGLAQAKSSPKAGKWPALGWIFLIASILFAGFTVLRIKSDIANFDLVEAKSQQDWAKTARIAKKQRTWYNQTDGMTGTPIAWFEGLAYLNMNQLPQAIEQLEIAKAWHPWHPQVLSNLGVARYLNNQKIEGIQELEDLLTRFPDFEDVRQNLCEIYMTEGKYADVRGLIVYWESHKGNPKYDGYFTKIMGLLEAYSTEGIPTQ